MMKNNINKYSQEYDKMITDDKTKIADEVIEYSKGMGIPIEEDSNKVKHLIDTDLRENIPPQMYEVICNIVHLIEELEK